MWISKLYKHLPLTLLYKNEYCLFKNKLSLNKINTNRTIKYLTSNSRTTTITYSNNNNRSRILFNINRNESTITNINNEISTTLFEQVCSETLDSLNDFFEDLVDSTPHLKTADITYSVKYCIC